MKNQQLREYCEAEFENIDLVVAEIFNVVKAGKSDYTTAELAAVATFMHNSYNGIENILKRVLLSKQVRTRETPTWHKDLLKAALDAGVLSDDLYEAISSYLSFRHFFVHAYSFNLHWDELKPLVENISDTIAAFKKAIDSTIEQTT